MSDKQPKKPKACKPMLSHLREMDYQKYLKTKHWAKIRAWIIALRGCKCEICGKSHQLRVHHLSYDRLGDPAPDDLRVLCMWCHRDQHHENPQVKMLDSQFRKMFG